MVDNREKLPPHVLEQRRRVFKVMAKHLGVREAEVEQAFENLFAKDDEGIEWLGFTAKGVKRNLDA